VYIVSAEIVGPHGEKLEKFTTLSYAGHLPGYTMGYNEHGLVYSVNTIFLKNTFPEKTRKISIHLDKYVFFIFIRLIENAFHLM